MKRKEWEKKGESDSVFLDEVHRTEEEIDNFLRTRSAESEAILDKARNEAVLRQKHGAEDIQVKTEAFRSKLLSEAEAEADRIINEGQKQARMEANWFEKHKPEIVSMILNLLLEVED